MIKIKKQKLYQIKIKNNKYFLKLVLPLLLMIFKLENILQIKKILSNEFINDRAWLRQKGHKIHQSFQRQKINKIKEKIFCKQMKFTVTLNRFFKKSKMKEDKVN